MRHLLIFSICILYFLSSCEDRLSWEKRYDELISFDKNEEIRKLEKLDINQRFNAQGKIKPRGKFHAFDETCPRCEGISSIKSSGDINLHLEKENMLAFDKDSISSFILYVTDEYSNDQKYGGVQGLREHGRIIYINPKTYAIDYVINMQGNSSSDKVYVRRAQQEVVSSAVGPLPIVNAIKE